MELNFEKANLLKNEKVFECTAEQSLDAEITLPDYYPEISKIHCVNSTISTLNRQCSNESVAISGQVTVSVVYSDKDGCLNSYEYAIPYNKSVDTKVDVSNADASIISKINYINYKALAPRRLELHGSANLNITCYGLLDSEIFLSSLDDVFTKTVSFKCCEPLKPIRKLTYVEDEFSLGEMPAVEKILRTNYDIVVTECKIINSKVVVKGDISIEIVYLCKSNRSHTIRKTVGYSQIIECDGAKEGAICEAKSNIMSFEIRLKSAQEDENKVISFEAKVETEVNTLNSVEITAISDVFSNKCLVEAEQKKIKVHKSNVQIEESFVCKKSFDLPESPAEIIDKFCQVNGEYCAIDENKLVIKGELTARILYKTESNEIAFFNKNIDFDYRYELDKCADDIKANVKISAMNLDIGAINEISAEIELKVVVTGCVYEEITLLDSVSVKEYEQISDQTAVLLYFAENETVWEIAKKFLASPQMICSINSLEGIDTVCNKVMLVPNCT